MYPNHFYLLWIILGCCACSSENKTQMPIHQTKFVIGSTQNRLEVLDYGGQGEPILLLAGLGNTAHIYDEFAPRLTNQFRVYALTRRGFGASDHPLNKYDTKTLTDDILAVLDSLHLDKVSLIGHSIAGEEITRFAIEYAKRVRKVVYLDAAYDRTKVNMPLQGGPIYTLPAKDKYNKGTYHYYLKAVQGIDLPADADEISQLALFSTTGNYVKDISPGFVSNAILGQVETPTYSRIYCPALAIYAEPTSALEVTPLYSGLDSINKWRAARVFPLIKMRLVNEQIRFEKEIAKGKVIVIKGANHYVFISHSNETAKQIQSFLQ
jgi:pimeloyl-ACP methyl ester carboxylesterase